MAAIKNVRVCESLDSDRQAILDVAAAAFGKAHGQEIADLVADLSKDPSAMPLLSLVATANDDVVGHILFTKARIRRSRPMPSSSILAPLSVHPAYQNQGIGGRLMQERQLLLKAAGVGLVFVFGHPGYYPKYGFSAARINTI